MMRKQREIDMNKELTPIGNIKEMMPMVIAARKNAAKREAMKIMRQQCEAMDAMERDENDMIKEDAHEFHGQVQNMFEAMDAFDDWMMQEKKFGNKF